MHGTTIPWRTRPREWLGSRCLLLVVAILATVGLTFTVSFRPMQILTTAGHDDGLYLRLATSLASGAWLGSYDQFTLMKGPGYPVFLAINSFLGLPISATQALFHCAAAGVFSWAMARTSSSRWLGLIVFIVLLWNPLFLTPRLVREAIYTGQILIVYGFAIHALLLADRSTARLGSAAASGIVLAWCWLTREEGVLLLPGIVVLFLAALTRYRRERSRVRSVVVAGAMIAFAFLGPNLAFRTGNLIAYGSFVGVDVRERNFVAALDALQSVRVGETKAFVPVSRAARAQIYEVSPAFASLKDYFDPPGGSPWGQGCAFWKWTCGEIASGWFIWALRDAASTTSHYRSPAAAMGFFGTLASEVEAACAAGKLKCEKSLLSYMPSVTSEQLGWIPAELQRAVTMLWQIPSADGNRGGGRSTGDREPLARAVSFLNHPVYTPPEYPVRHVFRGWYWSGAADWFSFEVRGPGSESSTGMVERAASPDLVSAFGTPLASKQRFRIDAQCGAECRLVFRSDGNVEREIPVDDLIRDLGAGHHRFPLGNATLWFDFQSTEQDTDTNDPRLRLSRGIRASLAKGYAIVAPWLLLLGAAAFIVVAVLAFRRTFSEREFALTALAASLWMVVITRVVALVLIAVSAFPAVNPLYMSSATYFAPVAAIVSLWAIAAVFRDRPATTSTTAPGRANLDGT